MTTPPDWLDQVLQARPVDDDGFTARVTGLAQGEVRTRWIVRAVVAAIVVGGLAACTGAELFFLDVMFDTRERNVDGRAWLDEHRAEYAQLVRRFDAQPALRRRSGRDAREVLDAALARFGDGRHALAPADRAACAHELASSWMSVRVATRGFDDEPRAHSACDTAWIAGLSAYDQWSAPWRPLDMGLPVSMARTHLRRAAARPVAPGEPAPFATAARDVEALGRLLLGNHAWGTPFFEVVAEEHERAARDGRAGDHVLVASPDDVRLLDAVYRASFLFSSPAATDDDVAAVGRMQSVLACDAIGAAAGDLLGARVLDEHRIERVRALDRTGCTPRSPPPLEDTLCNGLTPGFCRLVLAPLSLPPFRGQVILALERWHEESLPRLGDTTMAASKTIRPRTTAPTATTATATEQR